MKIDSFDTGRKILLIAEIGNNHEGDFELAKKMVESAKESGCSAVKFQSFVTHLYAGKNDQARYEKMQKFELSAEQFGELSELAKKLGLLFISTPLDLKSAEYLSPLVSAYKISSGDIDFYPLLDKVAASDKPIILSTGLSDMKRVEKAVRRIKGRRGNLKNIALLHCTSAYPTPLDQVNLCAIDLLREKFGIEVGYSDHTLGTNVAIAAAYMGATIIEKHFTFDKNQSDFRDHQLSADPAEMKLIADKIDEAQKIMGVKTKEIMENEVDVVTAVRRSIVAAKDIVEGKVIEIEDLAWVRRTDGLPPGSEEMLVGRKTLSRISAGDPLLEADVAKRQL